MHAALDPVVVVKFIKMQSLFHCSEGATEFDIETSASRWWFIDCSHRRRVENFHLKLLHVYNSNQL